MRVRVSVCLMVLAALGSVPTASATEWFVAVGGTGAGTAVSPFGRIQDAVNAAQPGDLVTVRGGTYRETIRTVRSGTATAPIRVRATTSRSVVVTVPGRVLTVDHAYVQIEGFVIDGQYGPADTVDVNSGAHFLVIRDTEVRRSSRDLVDISAPRGVLIERCLIHHALNPTDGRSDAHGIVAGAVQDLTVRDTEIHTFSGDGIQVDPGRSAPGWNRVTIERARIWLAPLPAAENLYAAGVVPGENAIDTKAGTSFTRSTIVIRDTMAWGFRAGMVANMAAFNLKENVDATVDRTTVYNSEIAFRLRGATSTTAVGAWVAVKNAVVYNTATAIRYENAIENLRIWNSTIGAGVTRPFLAASATPIRMDVRNLLVLGKLPVEAAHPSNLAVGADTFVNASAHNYELAAAALAIDRGVAIAEVATDRNGTARPQGRAYDLGAYERRALSSGEVVVHARRAPVIAGAWQVVADASAAGGARISNANAGASRLSNPLASPVHYFEVTAAVEAGRPYRVWLRGRADSNSRKNDSVFVQFSSSVDSFGRPVHRVGSTSAATINLEDCDGCGLSGWGWQDTGGGVNVLGPLVRFARSGVETVRIQVCEDGFSIDQIVLSPSLYLNSAPGSLKNDTTLLPEM